MRLRKFSPLLGIGLLMASAQSAETPTVHDLAWLSGHWCWQRDDQIIEEIWMPPRGESALGVGRTIKGDRTVTFEFMRIQTVDGITSYFAMHEGRPTTAFRLVASGADWVRFENPQHDFPQRVEYRRTPSGLHAEIAGPGKDGKEKVIPFEYRRCVD